MGSMSADFVDDPKHQTRDFFRRLLFSPAARYPADPRAVFMLAFSVFTGGTAFLLDAAPESLNSLLPHWAVLIWGVLLTLGSATTLGGMTRQSPNGIIVEQIGSVMVAATTLYYAVIATYVVGWSAMQTVGIVAAWGLSCVIRYLQLQALLNRGIVEAAVRQHNRDDEGDGVF